MTYTHIQYKLGKSKTAKVYTGRIPATLRKPLNRYSRGMTVGHGWFCHLTHIDQPGAACFVLGFFSDGRINMALPVGGNGILGLDDIEIGEPPSYVTAEQIAQLRALPPITRISPNSNLIGEDGREQSDTRKVIHA